MSLCISSIVRSNFTFCPLRSARVFQYYNSEYHNFRNMSKTFSFFFLFCYFVLPVLRSTAQFRFLAHLSRRLIHVGELIVYSWSGVRPSSYVVRRSQCSNIFFSETAGQIKDILYVEPPWIGGTKVCSRHLGYMTKMAATPIYGKNPSKHVFSGTGRPISTKLGM